MLSDYSAATFFDVVSRACVYSRTLSRVPRLPHTTVGVWATTQGREGIGDPKQLPVMTQNAPIVFMNRAVIYD